MLTAIKKYRELRECYKRTTPSNMVGLEDFPNEEIQWIYEYILSMYVLGLTFMAQNPNFTMKQREIRSNYFTENI